MINILRII